MNYNLLKLVIKETIPYVILLLSVFLYYAPTDHFWSKIPTAFYPMIVIFLFQKYDKSFPNPFFLFVISIFMDLLSNLKPGSHAVCLFLVFTIVKMQIKNLEIIDNITNIGIFLFSIFTYYITYWLINFIQYGTKIAIEPTILHCFSTIFLFLLLNLIEIFISKPKLNAE